MIQTTKANVSSIGAANEPTKDDQNALLRHTSTAMVKSPSHLMAALENEATFGQMSPKAVKEIQPGQSERPTGTKSGLEASSATEQPTEVVEKIGAGDGI